MASGCVPGNGGRRAGLGQRSSKSLFNQIHCWLPLRLVYGLYERVPLMLKYE